MKRRNQPKRKRKARLIAIFFGSCVVLVAPIAVAGEFAPVGTVWFYLQVAVGTCMLTLVTIIIIGSGRHIKKQKAKQEQEEREKQHSGESQ